MLTLKYCLRSLNVSPRCVAIMAHGLLLELSDAELSNGAWYVFAAYQEGVHLKSMRTTVVPRLCPSK